MPTPNKKIDVVVLGAGAAGLFCAFTAAARGRSVLVLEKANKPGKKILMSGGGRCNFTNYFVEADNFISQNPHFCKAALKRYTQWDFINLGQSYDIPCEERLHGQLFCIHSAKDILTMLLSECDKNGANVQTHCEVTEVNKTTDGFTVNYNHKESPQQIDCESLVVASGALSIPTLGGSDIGYRLAEQFGLPLLPRRAGLVPFMFSDTLIKPLCERLSGLAVDAQVQCNGQSFRENILFTHRGISGPAVLQISNYWQPGDSISINLMPDHDAPTWLLEQKQQQGKTRLKTCLQKTVANKLANELITIYCEKYSEQALADIPDQILKNFGGLLNRWDLKPSATEGYRTAEVTLGGIDTNAISSKTMAVKNQENLYFVGEVVDVTGHLGGFNFQWAWSSGYSAGLVV